MKLQDISFLVMLVVLLVVRNRQLIVYSGLGFLLASVPLFSQWIFFTAQRFVWYAALCFAVVIVIDSIGGKERI